jgi:prepilin-type N-terminal cleavage/methylation domain-containing protein
MKPRPLVFCFWRDEGLTFVELVIVLCIIGILAAIAGAVYVDMNQKARASVCKQNQAYIEAGASIGYAESVTPGGGGFGQYPASIQEMVERKLLDRYPTCPSGGNYNDYDPSIGLAHCSLTEHAR